MGTIVLPPIKWLELSFSKDGFMLVEIDPLKKIHIGHVTQFCRGTTGLARAKLFIFNALLVQHRDKMGEEALYYLEREIEALRNYAAK